VIVPIIRTAIVGLRRDRGALALTFVLPIAFFSIFAIIFGGRRNTTPTVSVILVDEDHSNASRELIHGLQHEGSLVVHTRPESNNNPPPPDYTAATAEAAVKADAPPIALIVPRGFGEHPIAFGPAAHGPAVIMLKDSGDVIAPQVVAGLLQKVALTSMPASMMPQGMRRLERSAGGQKPEQRARVEAGVGRVEGLQNGSGAAGGSGGFENGLITVTSRDVVGERKNAPIISYYAAAICVLFLLFTASGASGSLLDEAESGTLDRVLSSHINMTALLVGKLSFNVLLAFSQLVLMFLWAWLVFGVDFPSHIPGFVIIGVSTAVTVAALGMLLASLCHTRAQLGGLSTLVILIMSSIGGSMVPRFFMPESMQKAGLFTINAWAIDGFTKVFWRDQPVSALWPQVAMLLGFAVVFFSLARRFARRWEFS